MNKTLLKWFSKTAILLVLALFAVGCAADQVAPTSESGSAADADADADSSMGGGSTVLRHTVNIGLSGGRTAMAPAHHYAILFPYTLRHYLQERSHRDLPRHLS